MKYRKIELNIVKNFLDYNSETGIFTWKVDKAKIIKKGDKAGSKNRKGYWIIGINGKTYMAHRLAWLYVYSEWPEDQIDHINMNKQDNRIKNLRIATNGQNQANCKKQEKIKSGFKGAYYHKQTGKYTSKICHDRKQIHLGLYSDPYQAHLAYCYAASYYKGSFANFGE